MEHRHSLRIPAEFDVVLAHSLLGTLHGVARDLSSDGMYIVATERPLPLNALLTAQFRLGSEVFSEDVIVVHSNRDGAGVLFSQPLPKTLFAA